MKRIALCSVLLLTLFAANRIYAQCSFTPTITPDNPVLCPNQTDTLWTQVYDSYQWYKGDNAIGGATNQYYIVTQRHDVGLKFKVAATQNGCTAFSESVLVDEWAFTPPDLIISGDYGQYDFRHDARVLCKGDTMIATLSQPYSLNDQWYSGGKAIAGATNETYYITTAGSYTVCGAPEMCPDYIACENLPLNAEFTEPKASITQKHDTLFSSPGKQYQWFQDGEMIHGATRKYYVPSANGEYTVLVTNRWFCSAMSAPYNFMTRMEATSIQSSISISPNPADNYLHLESKTGSTLKMSILNLEGMPLFSFILDGEQNIPLTSIPSGMYMLQWQDPESGSIAHRFFVKQ